MLEINENSVETSLLNKNKESGIKVRSVVVPESRKKTNNIEKSINNWFDNFIPLHAFNIVEKL